MRHPNQKTFSLWLQRWAIKHGIKRRTQLAKELGFPSSRINQWFNRGVMPTKANLQRLSEETGWPEFKQMR